MKSSSLSAKSGSALYRAVWRWHFLAGLYVAPFAVFLAVTGALYLWKPQYEEWRYRDLFNVPVPANATPLSADNLFSYARRALPDSSPVQYLPAPRAGRSVEVQFGSASGAGKVSVYLNPYNGDILGTVAESKRLMTTIHDLHGTLLAGRVGEWLVELAASWAIVLLVSGFYLWWPRPFTARGFLLPRFGAGRRALLRDLHAVPAVWLSVVLLLLLTTGLQWTRIAGAWTRTLGQFVGQWTPRETNASAHRSELLGGWSPPLQDQTLARQLETVHSSPPSAHAGHVDHTPSVTAWRDDPRRITLERVVQIARGRQVTDAYGIAFPAGPTGVYSILSDRNRAFTRAYVHLDQYTGKVLADVRFKNFGFMGKFYSFGIIAHEGQLFGLANQLLGLLACVGVITLSVTGVLMWRARRPSAASTALNAKASFGGLTLFKHSRAAIAIALVLSVFLPLMAGTLVVLLIVDRVLGERWKLLQPAGSAP